MKIVYYAKRNLHVPHLLPVSNWIRDNHPEVEQVFASPPYIPSMEDMPGVGLNETLITDLKHRGYDWIGPSKIGNWRPDVTVMADADFGGIDWQGCIANVNHGLISKGTFYTNRQTVQRENGADLILVPGSHHAKVLQKMLHKPVLATGFVKFDPVGRGELTQQSAREKYGIGAKDRVVTFAPTYNIELSAVPVITDGLRTFANQGLKVLVKLHGMSPESWKQMYRLLALLEENIIYVDDMDLTPSIMAADVVISDVSSAFMEAMALNRPVILVNNPLQKRFPAYDPNDIEYAWRDVGVQVGTRHEIIKSVHHALDHPEDKEDRRKFYGPKLVGPIDGRAAERASTAIMQLAAQYTQRHSQVSAGWNPS